MQHQMSGASAPQLAPTVAPQTHPPVTLPKLVPGAPKRRKSRAIWILVVLAIVAGGAYWARQAASRSQSAAIAARAVPTATVSKGTIVRTIRLNGTTAA